MNSQRRRANDFTDSLSSFRQISDELNDSVLETISQDSLDTDAIRNKQCEDHNHAKNDASDVDSILAGNFVRQQCTSDSFKTVQENYINTYKDKQSISDILSASDKTSYISVKPDLNKCINLFHNEYQKEYDASRKSNLSSSLSELRVGKDIEYHQLNKNKTPMVQLIRDYPRSMSSISLKSTPSSIKIRKFKSCITLNSNLKKDTNYNIKSDKLSLAETATKSNQERNDKFVSLYDAFSLPKHSVLQNEKESYFTEGCQMPDLSNERSLKEELNPAELKKFLQSLDQKPIREEPVQERLLRRLSTNYNDSPKHFTERLLTIIEESFAIDSHADVSLCKLIEEFQKCNLIEDETAPEWVHSSPSMSISIRVRKGSQELKNNLLRKSLATTPNKDLSTPPRPHNISINSPYRRTPKNILHNIRSPQLDSTSTFESLEAYCEKLYSDEIKTRATQKENQCQSPLKNLNRILRKCENQMASLENSPNVYEQLKQAGKSTSDSTSQRNTVPEALCRLLSYEQCDKIDSQSVPDILKHRTEHNKHYERIKSDNLRHSLIHEIAKKRQKCIDTVKTMEIDMDLELTGEQKICPITTNNESNPSIVNDAKFMETLKCVKKYQDYLEQCKPLLSYLQQSESLDFCSSHDEKSIPIKNISNENLNIDSRVDVIPKTTLRVPKSSMIRKKSPLSPKPRSTNKIIVSKPKLFYTPGKTTAQAVIKNNRPKRTYFPNQLQTNKKKTESKQKENRPQRNASPHEKSFYCKIGAYDFIKSPVASYIRGTDPYLMKNLRPKTDENLLTPRKKQTQSPSPKPKLKFRLSPKEKSTQTSVRENIANTNLLHPKVNYKLPSYVRTIKEGANLKAGNRVNQLLRSTQDKVVIRHEGRPKSVQTDHLEQPEIHYDSAEESVHVEQTARKTCFSRVQKNY